MLGKIDFPSPNKEIEKIRNEYAKIKEKKKLILTTEKDYIRSFMGIDNVYYLYHLLIQVEYHEHNFQDTQYGIQIFYMFLSIS